MALADLIARLEREADARVSALEATAAAEAAALEAEAARTLAARRAHELTERRKARRARLDAELAQARREVRGAVLTAQHAVLAQVFARARGLLPALGRSPDYLAAVPAHFEEARRFVEGLEVVAHCTPEVAARLAGARGALQLEVEALASPGVVLRATDGSVVVDNTLAARLAQFEARLAVELLALLGAPAGAALRGVAP